MGGTLGAERGANQEKSKMVRGIHNLTKSDCFAHIKKCKKLGVTKLLCDGGGLYLRGTPTGAASWIFRFEQDGAAHEHGLGSVDTFDLDEAREKARRCRQLVAEGKDPIEEKRAARAAARALTASTAISSKSFKYCLMKYIAFTEHKWRSDKHRRDWEGSLQRYAFPVFDKGNKLVSTITMKDVLAVLEPHWLDTNETMRRVRSRVEMVWDWAKGQGYCSGLNPAAWKGNLASHLPAVPKETKNFAALAYRDIPELVRELQVMPAGADKPDVADDALIFTVLVAARSREVRFATWSEFDLATGVWEISGSRMKAKKSHRVPLSEPVIELLRRQPTFPRPGMPRTGFVFCDRSGVRALGEAAMLRRMQSLRAGVTVHGTARSCFSTWSSEVARCRYEVREIALAHCSDPVVAAYMRGEHLDERRMLMADWAQFCLTPVGGNVTPLRREVV
jgi:integrase